MANRHRFAIAIAITALTGCSDGPSPGLSAGDGHATLDIATPTDAPDASSPRDATDGDVTSTDVDASITDADTPGADVDATVTDAATSADVDATAADEPLFDMDWIADASTADCAFTNHRMRLEGTTALDVWDAAWTSWEVVDGQPTPIRIRGFAARPAGTEPLPAVVVAHGLGGQATIDSTRAHAARLGTFTLSYTGPGGGTTPENTSGGLPSDHDGGYRMFDVLDDVRGSWFWGHTTAALRGLTCLADRPDVDADRLGMTGYSAGAVATLLATGADPRIKAGVALSGTGAWDVATDAPNAWQHVLLAGAGLDTTSPEWTTLIAELDATNHIPDAQGALFMVNGTTDEFFPVTAHMATFDAIGGVRRSSLAANFDHGCYALTGVESADAIERRATIRAEGGQYAWFSHHLDIDPDFAQLPTTPTVDAHHAAGVVTVTAEVDASPDALAVDTVTFWYSGDGAAVWIGANLDEAAPGLWTLETAGELAPDDVWYVDVEYRTGHPLWPRRFSLSSPVHIPEGFVPTIRANDTCLP